MFESIVNAAREKFQLGDKAGTLLAALLGLIAENGFGGFLERFNSTGLGDTVSSWINVGDNSPLSGAQVNSALGATTVNELAAKAGLDSSATSSALGYMIPQVVDTLTPDGTIPEEAGLLSRIGGYLREFGGAAGATVGGAANRVGAADNIGDRTKAAVNRVDDAIDHDSGNSVLKWLLPLLLLLGLIILGFWFCNRTPTTTVTNVNANVNRSVNTTTNANVSAVDSSFSIKADNGKYTVSGVVSDEATKKKIVDTLTAEYGAGNVNFDDLRVDATAKPFAAGWWDNFAKILPNLKDWKTGTLAFAGNAITEAVGLPAAALYQLKTLFSGWTMPAAINGATANVERKLTEISLPDGKKLEAYPGGIEDQLIKFIESDEYKNGTADTLKDKWFSFDDLNFKFGTTELVPESKRQLDNIVAILKAFPDAKIKIGGYTDKKGDDAANKKLSDDRAKAVQAALAKAGVGAQVPEAEGYGEEFATVPETASDKDREIDRKTSVRLIK